jgi:hypothetical protein
MNSSDEPFEQIGDLVGDRNGLYRIRYGTKPDDLVPFVLTLTPQYVARQIGKTPPIKFPEIQKYAHENADKLKAVAKFQKGEASPHIRLSKVVVEDLILHALARVTTLLWGKSASNRRHQSRHRQLTFCANRRRLMGSSVDHRGRSNRLRLDDGARRTPDTSCCGTESSSPRVRCRQARAPARKEARVRLPRCPAQPKRRSAYPAS